MLNKNIFSLDLNVVNDVVSVKLFGRELNSFGAMMEHDLPPADLRFARRSHSLNSIAERRLRILAPCHEGI